MKRFAFALSLVAATAMAAAPLAAQTRNDGPWWDPGRTQTQTQGRNGGTVYGNDRNVNGRNAQADGVWRATSRDRNGNTIYVRTRYDSNGNLVREWATRNIIGRYSVIERRVISNANNRGTYNTRGSRNSNDRWDQNNGHDNGKHNGQYKNKNKNKGRNRDRDYDRDRDDDR